MNKYVVTSDLRKVAGKTDNLSYLKQAADLHPNWDIVDSAENKVVLKNNTGLLNYDPHIIFTYENGRFYMSPCKSYDSSLSWENQEGAINNSGNSYRFSVSGGAWSFAPEIIGIIINDYKIYLSFNVATYYYGDTLIHYYGHTLSFEIFDAIDKNASGMICQSSYMDNYSRTYTNFYIYANNIWYYNDWNSLWNRIGKIDIDKPANIYQKPSPKGAILAVNKTFYINTIDDKNLTPLWQFVGQSKTFYAKAWFNTFSKVLHPNGFYGKKYYFQIFATEGHFTRVATPEGVKECLIAGLDGQVMEFEKVERPTIWKQ